MYAKVLFTCCLGGKGYGVTFSLVDHVPEAIFYNHFISLLAITQETYILSFRILARGF